MDIDEGIERLLRSQAPADPRHRVGSFRDLLAVNLGRPRVVVRARTGRASPALGLAMLALVAVAVLVLLPLVLLGGQRSTPLPSPASPSPSPSPSPTPGATIAPSRVSASSRT